MPCTVDLFPVYSYYDKYDRINFLFFNTPLVPVLCEALALIEKNNLTEELPPYIRDIAIKWKEEHDKCDKSDNYLKNYRNKEEVLKQFIEFEKRICK